MMDLARILGGLSPSDAIHVYNALAQWSDNERNGIEETSPITEADKRAHAKHEAAVMAVEAVVAKLEAEFIKVGQ